jgi:peptidoglycan/xylan/chitin deacetylase (PgdA/CDA1 family)
VATSSFFVGRAWALAALLAPIGLIANCSAQTTVVESLPAPPDGGGSGNAGGSGTGFASSGSGSGSGGESAGASSSGSGSGAAGGSGEPGGTGANTGSGQGGSGGASGGASGATSGGTTAGTFAGPQNPDCVPLGGTAIDPGMYPQTTFDPQPTYIPKNVIVFTLDDGPDGIGCAGESGASSMSCTVLDNQLLTQNGIKADFFINTANRCPVAPDTGCWTYVQQLLQSGHSLGNHTVNHYHLAPGGSTTDGIMHCTDTTCVDGQLSGVEATVAAITNQGMLHLTRFRAPFGEPHQAGSASDLALVEPVVATYAVEVDWNFDSTDSNGTLWDPTALFQYVTSVIKTPGKGVWGIMLAHAVYPWTHDMLAMLIPYLKQNGFVLGSVEDVLCWRFGKHSWEIIPNRSPN